MMNVHLVLLQYYFTAHFCNIVYLIMLPVLILHTVTCGSCISIHLLTQVWRSRFPLHKELTRAIQKSLSLYKNCYITFQNKAARMDR